MGKNCHSHVWILSGTGDGPPLVKALLLKGCKVSVSVVSLQASLPYSQLPLEALFVGALEGAEAIRQVLEKARLLNNGFDWVIDATHPFAQVISLNLKTVCRELEQPLLRFERSCPTIRQAFLIKSPEDLRNFDLKGQKLLFAIGSKFLPEALNCACQSGASVFARVLPTVESLNKALSSNLPEGHLAVVRPSTDDRNGALEEALCRRWGITGVIARQSGGPTQKIWQRIAKKERLKLWLISRPKISNDVCVFNKYSELSNYL